MVSISLGTSFVHIYPFMLYGKAPLIFISIISLVCESSQFFCTTNLINKTGTMKVQAWYDFMANTNTTRLWMEKKLLDQVRNRFPETKRMTYTGLVDWALRKLLENKEPSA